jgi:7-cyano-7-deazaguanine synthase
MTNLSADVLLLLSGGLDSAACLAYYRASKRHVTSVFIDYEHPARRAEERAARLIAEHYGVPLSTFRMSHLYTASGEVMGRNALLVLAALSLWRRTGPSMIGLGIHAGTRYADCSPAFVENMQALVDIYASGMVMVDAPFLHWRKSEIYQYAVQNGVPLELAYSCEEGSSGPCGKCRSCRDLEAINAG